MKLKKYFEFIKESIELDDKTIWKLSKDDIMEYFLDMKDEGWLVRVDFGFVFNKVENFYINGKLKSEEREIYTELVLPGDSLEPAYLIYIFRGRDVTNVDVTDSLLFAKDILKDIAGAREIKAVDDDYEFLNIDDVLAKGGLFLGKELKDEEQTEISSISLFIKTGDEIKLSQKQVAEYYSWEYDRADKHGNIYTHVELEDIANSVLTSKSYYKDVLIKGTEFMWYFYEIGNYIPDTQSFFQYTLSKENEILMVKAMIKEIGGWSVLKDENIVTNINKDFSSEEDFINYVLKERFYYTLEEMCVDSEICQDIKQTVADWEMSSHLQTNYDEILSSFDDIVGKNFEYKRITKEVTKEYTDGNENIREYKKNVIFYEIKFNRTWIDQTNWDSDDLEDFDNIYNIFYEYCNFNYYIELSPRISDWGNVDTKSLNSEISAILNKYLNK
jgi:hypothetical protein